jgi:hypothetical protein
MMTLPSDFDREAICRAIVEGTRQAICGAIDDRSPFDTERPFVRILEAVQAGVRDAIVDILTTSAYPLTRQDVIDALAAGASKETGE